MPKVQDVQHVRKTANTICSIIFCVNRKMFTNFKGICVFHNTFASKFYPTCCLAVKPCVVDTDPPSLPTNGQHDTCCFSFALFAIPLLLGFSAISLLRYFAFALFRFRAICYSTTFGVWRYFDFALLSQLLTIIVEKV